MNRYVIDAYGWIEYFISSKKGEKVKEIIENKNNEIFTSILTLSEVISKTKKEARDYEIAYESILNLSKIYNINEEFCKEIGLLYREIRSKIKDFGIIDTFVLLTAKKLNAKIITGDPHFKDFKETIMI